MMLVGTAGWSIPRACAPRFAGTGTHLQRYARVLRCVEIDTSFYRDHSAGTYANWATQTPRHFRFAVKLPREITHEQRLRAARRPLERFLDCVAGLGRRLGPLIVQLPPSLTFDAAVARRFFRLMREHGDRSIVCEPRHASWFEARAEAVLCELRIGRVAADPAIVPSAAQPGGWPGVVYCRLHGSPRKYWSVYQPHQVLQWTKTLQSLPRRTPAWCIFDNTAAGGAAHNALQMMESLQRLPAE